MWKEGGRGDEGREGEREEGKEGRREGGRQEGRKSGSPSPVCVCALHSVTMFSFSPASSSSSSSKELGLVTDRWTNGQTDLLGAHTCAPVIALVLTLTLRKQDAPEDSLIWGCYHNQKCAQNKKK